MKVLLLCMFFCSLLFISEKQPKVLPAQQAMYTDTTTNPHSDTINFSNHVQPILVTHCSPCHFIGGKMYGKLPFDKAETIITHNEGVLRRIKDEKENALIKTFVEQQKKL